MKDEKMNSNKKMVPGSGIEPPTLRSSGACSTTELPRQKQEMLKRMFLWYRL